MAFKSAPVTALTIIVTLGVVTSQDQGSGIVTIPYSLYEESPAFTFVGNLGTDMENKGVLETLTAQQLSLLTFSILSDGNLAKNFIIESDDGVLRTGRRIDRDEICPQKDTCVIDLDIGVLSEPNFFEVVKVKVTLDDLNDNPPRFLEDQITRSIAENTATATKITIPTADDIDSPEYGIKRYEMIQGSPEFELHVSESMDSIYLVLKEELDRETRSTYTVVIAAFDGGQTPKSGTLTLNIAVLDVNDNHPQFTQSNQTYQVTVKEDQAVDSVIVRVQARDADSGANGLIWYGFGAKTKLNFGRLFKIDNTTGDIILIDNLDYEQTQSYNLIVTASEMNPDSIPAEAKVVIHVEDINDHPPHITVNAVSNKNVQISEAATVGTFVAHIKVNDPDLGRSGQFSCQLQTELTTNVFEIQELYSSEFKLVTSGSLDRELMPEYDLKFICSDMGNPSLTSMATIKVTVLDENDNTPTFSHQTYAVTLNENNYPGAVLVQVSANDHDAGDNGKIVYILDEEASHYLNIDSNTGNISAKIAFDFEKVKTLTLLIYAMDSANPPQSSSAVIEIRITDVNDEAPEFNLSKYTFRIDENDAIGQEVGEVMATDHDSNLYNEFTFSIDDSSGELDKAAFTIDPSNGKIYTRKKLDREYKTDYALIVKAMDDEDSGLFRTTVVSIFITDKNDNEPIISFPSISNNTVVVSEIHSSSAVLAQIKATDIDSGSNAKLSFFISSGNENQIFTMDKDTGYLSFNPEVKSIQRKVYRLIVSVSDHGSPPKVSDATLNVVVNHTLTMAQGDPLIPGSNLTIVISVAVISGVLTVILIVAIVLMCHRQGRKNYLARLLQYNGNSNGKGLVGEGQGRSDDSLDSIENKKNKKEVSFSNEVEISDEYPPNFSLPYDMQQKPTYSSNQNDPYSCPPRQAKKQACNQPYPSHHDLQLQPKAIQNNYIHMPGHGRHPKDQDSDSAHSEDLSNTDSGRGSNEDAELSSHPNSLEAEQGHKRGAANGRGPTSPSSKHAHGGNFKHQAPNSATPKVHHDHLARRDSHGRGLDQSKEYPQQQQSPHRPAVPPRRQLSNNGGGGGGGGGRDVSALYAEVPKRKVLYNAPNGTGRTASYQSKESFGDFKNSNPQGGSPWNGHNNNNNVHMELEDDVFNIAPSHV